MPILGALKQVCLSNMRVLVTGLDGFTGRYVSEELERFGHTVVGIKSDLVDNESLKSEILDIAPDGVVHLAAVSFVGHGDPKAFYDVNLVGTRNLLEALVHSSRTIQSVLLASSANVYGNRSERLLDEGSPVDPVNDYAVSKYAMEVMSKLFQDRLPIVVTRPFNYTGLGQDEKFLIPKIVSHFKQKAPVIELGNIDVWREFGDVRSVAYIYGKLIEACPAGNIINVCTGQLYSLKEVIDLCMKITGHNIEIRINPEFVRQNEVRTLKGDKTKLENTIGTLDTYSLQDTLSWMLHAA